MDGDYRQSVDEMIEWHIKNCDYCKLRQELEEAEYARDNAKDPGLEQACDAQAQEIAERLEDMDMCDLWHRWTEQQEDTE